MRCKAALLLFLATLFVYAYFFQGGGFNQNAHFDTVRALVERRTFEITEYATDTRGPGFTGDISTFNGRVYSSKPPGLPLLCAPFYAIVYAIEKSIGIDTNSPRVVWANQWLTTIWGAAIPSALLVVAAFYALVQRGLTRADALILAAGFAFGSLFFPYAGMLTIHPIVTLCLFLAWLLQRRGRFRLRRAQSSRDHLLAGALLGLAIFTDISAAPPVIAYAIVAWLQNRRAVVALLIGPILVIAATLLYQHILFGAATELPTSHVNVEYHDANLFLGHFNWPDLRRLWWLSFHPLRGLFYTCPIVILALLSPLAARGVANQRPRLLNALIPAAVIANFLLFNLTFHAWTAGWGTGPRYLMPTLPFLIVLSVRGYQRFRPVAYLLIAISTLAMFAVAAERLQWGANLYGPPRGDHPVPQSIMRLVMRQVALDKDISNLGLQLGLRGSWSLVPPALVIIATVTWAWTRKRTRSHEEPEERAKEILA